MFEYKIKSVDADKDTGAITAVWVEIMRKVNDAEQHILFGVPLDYNVNDASFVPYELVNENMVLNWVNKAVNESEVTAQFDRMYPTKISSGLPWQNVPAR